MSERSIGSDLIEADLIKAITFTSVDSRNAMKLSIFTLIGNFEKHETPAEAADCKNNVKQNLHYNKFHINIIADVWTIGDSVTTHWDTYKIRLLSS